MLRSITSQAPCKHPRSWFVRPWNQSSTFCSNTIPIPNPTKAVWKSFDSLLKHGLALSRKHRRKLWVSSSCSTASLATASFRWSAWPPTVEVTVLACSCCLPPSSSVERPSSSPQPTAPTLRPSVCSQKPDFHPAVLFRIWTKEIQSLSISRGSADSPG